MSCKSCEETQEAGFIAYYRVDKANVAISGCGEHVRKVFEAMERGEINKPTQPTNSIDSELEKILKTLKSDLNDYHTQYYKREIPDVMTFTDLQNDLVTTALQAIKAKYISRKEVEEAIANAELYNAKSTNGILNPPNTGVLAVPVEVLRAKLLPNTKGGNASE